MTAYSTPTCSAVARVATPSATAPLEAELLMESHGLTPAVRGATFSQGWSKLFQADAYYLDLSFLPASLRGLARTAVRQRTGRRWRRYRRRHALPRRRQRRRVHPAQRRRRLFLEDRCNPRPRLAERFRTYALVRAPRKNLLQEPKFV